MLESGEYFLSQEQKAARAKAAQAAKQAAKVEERQRQRDEAFVAPKVRAAARAGWVGRHCPCAALRRVLMLCVVSSAMQEAAAPASKKGKVAGGSAHGTKALAEGLKSKMQGEPGGRADGTWADGPWRHHLAFAARASPQPQRRLALGERRCAGRSSQPSAQGLEAFLAPGLVPRAVAEAAAVPKKKKRKEEAQQQADAPAKKGKKSKAGRAE